MNHDRQLWRLETQFRLAGADFYERTLCADALMVFPPPAGVLDRAATLESVRGARWRTVSIDARHLEMPDSNVAVLAYVARAERGEAESAYVAQCSSTYVLGADGWRLALHHQTPLGEDGDPRT